MGEEGSELASATAGLRALLSELGAAGGAGRGAGSGSSILAAAAATPAGDASGLLLRATVVGHG